MNFILCLVVLAVGTIVYVKTKNKTPFHIGIAFGLFGISHMISLMGLENSFTSTMVLPRAFGYLIIMLTIVKRWGKECC